MRVSVSTPAGVNFNLGRFAVKCVPWCERGKRGEEWMRGGAGGCRSEVIDVAYSSALPSTALVAAFAAIV